MSGIDPKGTNPLSGLIMAEGFGAYWSTTPFARSFTSRDEAAIATGNWAFPLSYHKYELGGWLLHSNVGADFVDNWTPILSSWKPSRQDAYGLDLKPYDAPEHADGIWHTRVFEKGTIRDSVELDNPLMFSDIGMTKGVYKDIPISLSTRLIIYLTYKGTTMRFDPENQRTTTVVHPRTP